MIKTKIGNYTLVQEGKLIDILDENNKSVCWFNIKEAPALLDFLDNIPVIENMTLQDMFHKKS